MEVLASKSNRIHIENRGYTFEDRPLLLLTITSPNNHQNLAQIQEQHLILPIIRIVHWIWIRCQ